LFYAFHSSPAGVGFTWQRIEAQINRNEHVKIEISKILDLNSGG
jgi:hypothetical protein